MLQEAAESQPLCAGCRGNRSLAAGMCQPRWVRSGIVCLTKRQHFYQAYWVNFQWYNQAVHSKMNESKLPKSRKAYNQNTTERPGFPTLGKQQRGQNFPWMQHPWMQRFRASSAAAPSTYRKAPGWVWRMLCAAGHHPGEAQEGQAGQLDSFEHSSSMQNSLHCVCFHQSYICPCHRAVSGTVHKSHGKSLFQRKRRK